MSRQAYDKINKELIPIAGLDVIDPAPVQNSDHAVSSGGVYTALDDKAGKNQISNPNLIDNPWFTINSRGQSSYATGSSQMKYSVDRWLMGLNYTLNVSDNGISYSTPGNLYQRIESSVFNTLIGKTVTYSAMFSDGTLFYISGLVTNEDKTFISLDNTDIYMAFGKDSNYCWLNVKVKDSSNILRAVKLELGSISTLVMDTAPNYAFELAKCRASTVDPTDIFANQGQINVGTSNPNLIRNAWFTVNSRGQDSYSNDTFCFDRWYIPNNTTVVKNNDKTITLTSTSGTSTKSLRQRFTIEEGEKLKGKIVTLSALDQNNNVFSGKIIIPTNWGDSQEIFLRVYLTENTWVSIGHISSTSGKSFAVWINVMGLSTSLTIKAVKLELGSISTLATDTIPDYGTEIQRCQMTIADSDTYANYNSTGAGLTLSLSQQTSTSQDTIYTFSNAAIRDDSMIDVYTDQYGVNPSNVDVTVTNNVGTCTVTIPKQSTASTLGVKIYVR